MNLSALDNALWAASLIGHVALLLILIVRKRAREFPVFTLFVASEVLRTVLLFLVLHYGTKHGYFLAYWITGFANYLFRSASFSRLGDVSSAQQGGGWLKLGNRFSFG